MGTPVTIDNTSQQQIPVTGSMSVSSVADGNITTLGTTTESSWSGTGAGTVIAILKKIVGVLTGGVATTTADGANVTQGTTTDTAYNGTGAASIVSALKGIYSKLAGTLNVSISGTPSVNSTIQNSSLAITAAPNNISTATVGQVTVSTTATQIFATNVNRHQASFYNSGSVTVYIGTSNSVTTSNGYLVPSGQHFTDTLTTSSWYGIVAAGTAVLSTIEV